MLSRKHFLAASLALLAVAASAPAAAQEYPARPVTLVSPYPPGGITDLLARMLGVGMAKELGQPVVVVNRAGGGGSIGAAFVAQAPADGYTILLGALGPLSLNKLINPDIPYRPQDFAPIVQIGSAPVILAVNPKLPVDTLSDYVALVRKDPSKFNVATSGAGTPGHLSGVLFDEAAQLKTTFVHYKGAGPSLTDVIGGQVQASFENAAALLPHLQARKLKPLVVFSPKRLPMLPDVPTLEESGFKGVEANGWYGLVAPAGTPKAITEKLRVASTKALQADSARLAELGVVVAPGTSERFGAFVREELQRWEPVVKRLQIPKE
jgi:tripartite-type tricarboxylate transporter receptor subunit TctC